jgi:hypothetical protein
MLMTGVNDFDCQLLAHTVDGRRANVERTAIRHTSELRVHVDGVTGIAEICGDRQADERQVDLSI